MDTIDLPQDSLGGHPRHHSTRARRRTSRPQRPEIAAAVAQALREHAAGAPMPAGVVDLMPRLQEIYARRRAAGEARAAARRERRAVRRRARPMRRCARRAPRRPHTTRVVRRAQADSGGSSDGDGPATHLPTRPREGVSS